MEREQIDIGPGTTVHELLITFPELEDKLIEMASPFKKLRNPMLRKSIAKIATLKHIASVAGIPLTKMVNMIRVEAGQSKITEDFEDTDYFTDQPV